MRAPVAGLFVLAGVVAAPVAEACGVLASRTTKPFEYPYLTEERVLLVWDQKTKKEHFVREVRFEKANQPIGFVVPTPTRPEVQKVDKNPFPALQEGLPFDTFVWGFGHGSGTGFGYGGGKAGSGGGSGPPPVEVLAVQRIGRFDAFTLAAHDTAAFRRWLDDNQFATTPELEQWLGHYVTLGFHFVAFRYVAKPEDAPGMSSEVVRISFDTELPYYPYFEPRAPDRQYVRRLTAWFVSQEKMQPIASVLRGGKLELVRPWHAGAEYHPTPKLLGATLAGLEPLLPEAPELQVQVFRDRKVSRNDFHDLLLVPTAAKAGDEAKQRAMLAWLDPNLLPAPASPEPATPAPSTSSSSSPAPSAVASTPPSPAPSAPPAPSCALGRSEGGASWLLLGLALWRRRARRLAVLGAALTTLACGRSSAPAPAPAASTAPSATTNVIASASASSAPSAQPSASPSASSLAPEERKVREALLLAAFAGTLPSAMRVEAGPFADPPPVTVSISRGPMVKDKNITVVGKLPDTVIRRILRANFPRLRFCYESALKREPNLAGTFHVQFTIDPTGAISAASPAGGTVVDATLTSCMLGVIRSVSFPEPDGGKVAVRYTLELTNER